MRFEINSGQSFGKYYQMSITCLVYLRIASRLVYVILPTTTAKTQDARSFYLSVVHPLWSIPDVAHFVLFLCVTFIFK